MPLNDLKQLNRLHAVRSIREAIAAVGGEVRVVGGAVRDLLMQKALKDVDLAVNLPILDVQNALNGAGIKTAATGLAHGTITAIVDHQGFEITTLRVDLVTDGRHAEVGFTSDWQADAARRDFTFNALYFDQNDQFFDYFDGLNDLKNRLVRFIGAPDERIKEDHLRILRAFRFCAQISSPESPANIEEGSLKACYTLAHLMQNLSPERVWKEIYGLLSARYPMQALRYMEEGKLWPHILREKLSIDGIEQLIEAEGLIGRLSPMARFAQMLQGNPVVAASLLRLSRVQADRLKVLMAAKTQWPLIQNEADLRQKLYDFGTETVLDALLLQQVKGLSAETVQRLAPVCSAWSRPVFPLTGQDLLSMGGISQGKAMGDALRHAEAMWRAKDFRPTKDECLAAALGYLKG